MAGTEDGDHIQTETPSLCVLKGQGEDLGTTVFLSEGSPGVGLWLARSGRDFPAVATLLPAWVAQRVPQEAADVCSDSLVAGRRAGCSRRAPFGGASPACQPSAGVTLAGGSTMLSPTRPRHRTKTKLGLAVRRQGKHWLVTSFGSPRVTAISLGS